MSYVIVPSMHYITLETTYSGLRKGNFKDHCCEMEPVQFSPVQFSQCEVNVALYGGWSSCVNWLRRSIAHRIADNSARRVDTAE